MPAGTVTLANPNIYPVPSDIIDPNGYIAGLDVPKFHERRLIERHCTHTSFANTDPKAYRCRCLDAACNVQIARVAVAGQDNSIAVEALYGQLSAAAFFDSFIEVLPGPRSWRRRNTGNFRISAFMTHENKIEAVPHEEVQCSVPK